MANSKSNIYPIQLQGAELNLNKLDAEIKQYSGFNKNNSPFVGGCLSNVFHKEEQIIGGNADNTYIDTNGDVYRVDTEGLFKNGEKLIDLDGKKFYDVVESKTQFPNNTVYVDSEECYITLTYKRGTGYENLAMEWQLHIFNPFTEEWEVINMTDLPTNKNGIDVQFYVKSCKDDNALITFIVWNFRYDSSSGGGKLLAFKTTSEGTSQTYTTSLTTYPEINRFLHLEKAESDNEGVLSVFDNYSNELDIRRYSFDMSGNVTSMGTSSYLEYLAAETKLYKIKHDEENRPAYEEVLFDYEYHDGNFVTSNAKKLNNAGIPKGSTTVTVSNKKPFGYLMVQDENLNTSHGFFGLCDFITPVLSNSDNKIVINMGAVTGDYVLYNNTICSGICLPGGYVLASEWNTVDEKNIYVQKYKSKYEGVYNPSNCEVLYKTGNKWVKLIESTPKLKYINGQVVVNTNHYFNSYDIVKNKKLLFAPAWNNRAPAAYGVTRTSSTPDNNVYVATAINEYNLADNSSILLNPVPTFAPSWWEDRYEATRESEIYVDVYKGNADTGIIYSKSMLVQEPDVGYHQFYFDDLDGLPFPTNSDGNVQYSPSIFCDVMFYGTEAFIKEGKNVYQLMKSDNQLVMSFFLGTLIENLQYVFIIQGQYYGIIGNYIFAIQFNSGVLASTQFIVDVSNLQFVGNTPYEALFFSKTNRCLYSFTGANVLNQKQLVDKISEVRNYLYNPATQTVFLITDIGVLFYGLFGMFLLEYTNISNIFLLDNGIVMSDNGGNYRYIKYYLDEGDEGYTKENIRLETCFYGMNNEVVTINDCLYFRLFSEEHEEGNLKVSATTISLRGRKTEETTFKIKASDWDKITHTIYLRYQPKAQRGLGVSFSIDSPFKIASMSVGSQPDAVLVDKVSKGAITAPSVTTNNNEW